MPIYEYHCNRCEHDFEKLVLSSSEDICCPKCEGKKVRRLMSGFSYKSSGSFSSSAGPSCSGCTSSSCSTCH